MSDLTEQPCTATGCSNGMITIPKAALDSKGRPITVKEVITCIVCKGNGKVLRWK